VTSSIAEVAQLAFVPLAALLVLEDVATLLLWPWIFRLGPRLTRTWRFGSGPAALQNEGRIELGDAILAAVGDEYWIFRHRGQGWFGGTLLTLRGTVRFGNGVVEIGARQTIAGPLVLLALAGVIGNAWGLIVIPVYAWCWFVETSRFERIAQQIQGAFGLGARLTTRTG
jgi:hypothetical protein